MNNFVSTGYSSFITVAALILLLICVGITIYSRSGMKKLKDSAYADPITGGLTQSGFYAKYKKTLNNDIILYFM